MWALLLLPPPAVQPRQRHLELDALRVRAGAPRGPAARHDEPPTPLPGAACGSPAGWTPISDRPLLAVLLERSAEGGAGSAGAGTCGW